jgi:hypothetical protein
MASRCAHLCEHQSTHCLQPRADHLSRREGMGRCGLLRYGKEFRRRKASGGRPAIHQSYCGPLPGVAYQSARPDGQLSNPGFGGRSHHSGTLSNLAASAPMELAHPGPDGLALRGGVSHAVALPAFLPSNSGQPHARGCTGSDVDIALRGICAARGCCLVHVLLCNCGGSDSRDDAHVYVSSSVFAKFSVDRPGNALAVQASRLAFLVAVRANAVRRAGVLYHSTLGDYAG